MDKLESSVPNTEASLHKLSTARGPSEESRSRPPAHVEDKSLNGDRRIESQSTTIQANGNDPTNTKEQSQLVDWDGPNDPENPLNFSFLRKCWITAMISLMSFMASFGSSVFSGVVTATAKEFHVSDEVMILGVTLYVLGFACGPLVWGPLSETGVGRMRPLHAGFAAFVIFQIPVGVATNLQTIFVCRFFAGAFGVASIAITAGVVVDIWGPLSRATAVNIFTAGAFAGPAMGPIVSEYVTIDSNLGWRWSAWMTMILGAAILIPAVLTLPETYAPTLLQRKAARLRFETKNWALHSKLDEDPVEFKDLLFKYGLRPVRMILQEPILVVVTLHMSLVYGILYLTFFAYPISFEEVRGIPVGQGSLPFLAIFIGVVLATAIMTWETRVFFNPKFVKAKKPIPEERLPVVMAGAVILVVGLFWFAWTSFSFLNPWPQIISGVFVGCGFVIVFMTGVVYIVDVYLYEANSALAVNSLIRSAFAGAFPLFAGPMYRDLGVQWATSLLAFLCVALLPAPFILYFYGKRIRSWSKYAYAL